MSPGWPRVLHDDIFTFRVVEVGWSFLLGHDRFGDEPLDTPGPALLVKSVILPDALRDSDKTKLPELCNIIMHQR